MSLSDPLGDMLTRIRNGQQSGRPTVICPSSKLRSNVLEVLKREGFIRDFSWAEIRSGISELTIELKYHDGQPVIREIKRVSTPGRRVYSKIKDLPRIYNGLGISILSTPRGVLSDAEARERIADLSAKLQQAESRGSAAEARRVEDLEELARARDAKAIAGAPRGR